MSEMIAHPVRGVKKLKPVYLIGGGVVIVGGYVWWMRSQASDASAPAVSTDDTGDSGVADTGDVDTGDYGTDNTSDYGTYSGVPTTGTGVNYIPLGTPVQVPATNAQWFQAAEDYLVNSANMDPATVAAALGKFLAHQNLSDSQYAIVQAAVGAQGYPPSGPNTILHSVPSGQTTAPAKPAAPHLTAKSYTTSLKLSWTKPAHVTRYEVHYDGKYYEAISGNQASVPLPVGKHTWYVIPFNGTTQGTRSNIVTTNRKK